MLNGLKSPVPMGSMNTITKLCLGKVNLEVSTQPELKEIREVYA